MQLFSISFTDLSLLFAVGAIILLISAELTSPYYGLTNLIISNKKLKNIAMAISTLFLGTVVVQLIVIITNK